MIVTASKGEYAINRLSKTEFEIIISIVDTVNNRCFDAQNEDGNWYSNDDFILMLTDEQRCALKKIGEEIELIFSE